MSWGGQPPNQYGGYGAGQAGQGQAGYGAPQGYQQQRAPGPPPSNQLYGGQQGYGNPGGQQQGYGAPAGYRPPGQQQQGYGAPAGQYGQPGGQYGQPGGQPGGQYGAPQGQFGGFQPAGYGQPAPPPGVSQEVWGWFQAVDGDRNGKITSEELRQALHNGNWSPFNAETCRLMVGMFDKDRSGTIDVQEFAALWKYVQDWKSCFDRFDTDRSGNIDAGELSNAFRTFGYNLSPQFCDVVVRTFDRRGARNIQFDDFIQACVLLKTLTDKFRAKDTQQNGTVRISYEEFLEMVLDTTLIKGAT
ncbi:programmed cell death protein 6-like isoform X1 [Mya arenaria]|uniref:programmed cell death protein 6-like isoform X1 n=1 Tax=Mya arenaria TaxID=6604 RepID=UPI0022DF0051|nr:programmed cell death protein 6-like isoform X1 [Mya arenaria]